MKKKSLHNTLGFGTLLIMAFTLWYGCENSLFNAQLKTPVHLELTAAQATSPQEIKLYFSEIIADKNTETKNFEVINSSTGKIFTVTEVKPSGQIITLSLAAPTKAAPHTLVAGHVYDVRYNVFARDNIAEAKGSKRLTADYYPSKASDPQVYRDSSGNIMIQWTPNRRVGNSGTNIYKDFNGIRPSPVVNLSTVSHEQGVFWLAESPGSTSLFSISTSNIYGEGEKSGFVSPQAAKVKTFACMNRCLNVGLDWPDRPTGYQVNTETSYCTQVEYVHPTNPITYVRSLSPLGVVQTRITPDSTSTDSVFNWCKS